MARIVLADRSLAFNGKTAELTPLGGAERALVSLVEALAARGHQVSVHNNSPARIDHKGVSWVPVSEGLPLSCDLYIANRAAHLIAQLPGAQRRVFWIHNPARYLLKPRFLWPLLCTRPVVVFSGTYHASTLPAWVPSGGRKVIPYGIGAPFTEVAARTQAPRPIAIFTSNPERGLDWLLDRWQQDIAPDLPQAELHIYGGAEVYGGRNKGRIAAVMDRAKALTHLGVRLCPPAGKAALAEVLGQARVMLYRGDPGETFCLAVAEAQAAGLPAVVQPLGSLPERVIDGQSGFVCKDDHAFSQQALRLLRDDELWLEQHKVALAKQRGWSWDKAAAEFESLLA